MNGGYNMWAYSMSFSPDELYHHGILGQKWGAKNGPPYPLRGGDYSKREKNEIYKARRKKNSIYNKKHFDQVIKKGASISTLSYNKDRTKNVDMFYGAFDKTDKATYGALFNKKIPTELFDENGNSIGTGEVYKYRINNIAKYDIKIASEDSGEDSFIYLYSHNRDFCNFVSDPNRMQRLFVKDKYKFSGYREAARSLDRIRQADKPKEEDLRTAYRMFNYVIPSDGEGDSRAAKDIAIQRAKLFTDLKQKGYGALLDTNDSIYGGFKTNAPVIVFDPTSIVEGNINRTTTINKGVDEISFAVRRALGF